MPGRSQKIQPQNPADRQDSLDLGALLTNATLVDIEICSGAGGLAVGLKNAGFSPGVFFELDSHSCATLRENIKSTNPTLLGSVLEGKVENADWRPFKDRVRLLAAGTPCQPFSLAGKHLADKDGRNLFPELMRAFRALRPMGVFLENVRGLARASFRPYFEYILRQLECPSVRPRHQELWQSHDKRIRQRQLSVGYEPEYRVTYRLVDAADYGVPQNRQRVIIVATRRDFPAYELPKRTHSREALLHALESGDYWKKHGIKSPNGSKATVAGNGVNGEVNGALPWVTVRDALRDLPPPADSEEGAAMNHWKIPGARSYAGHNGSEMDWPSKTIKAGVHGVPGGENTIVEDDNAFRYFTLRETARLQTFPDAHVFTGARIRVTRQIGNAVPCHLATVLARPLYDLIQAELAKRATKL
ncbi:MAG: (cytosine-5)-methyltransferase 1 [Chthoniobacter sp.]|jgi:DNA (cytosine-5)-methyltransferase 1|nr:(cytosine-5)-methyltransferase 1 [Chthoniobacter sp.]